MKSRIKSEFSKLLNDPQYSAYLDSLLQSTMIKKMTNDSEATVDVESYEEVRTISLDLESEVISPED